MEGSLAAWTNGLMAPPFAGYIFVGRGMHLASQGPVFERVIVFRKSPGIITGPHECYHDDSSCTLNCALPTDVNPGSLIFYSCVDMYDVPRYRYAFTL